MTTSLKQAFIERLASGLSRKSITNCARWAEQYRVMKDGNNWSFKYRPWLREMHNCEAEFMVGQKCAQVGYTEWAMNRAFYEIDMRNSDCLYILPTTDDASDFSAGRFDPALEHAPHLQKMFSDVKNVGHKRAGTANLYIRGSRSRSKLKSIPTGLIIFDEVEEMAQDNIPLAMERASGQFRKMVLMISTPSVPEYGINHYYNLSTMGHFFFPCPSCNRQTELVYPDCLAIVGESQTDPRITESHLICKECKAKLPHELKYEWLADGKFVEEHPGRPIVGYTVSQLYSSTVKPSDIAIAHYEAMTSPIKEQELYNSKLGMTRVVGNAQVTDAHLNTLVQRSGYKKGRNNIIEGMIRTMGVDVGAKKLHYEIDQWHLPSNFQPGLHVNDQCVPSIITEGWVPDFETLFKMFHDYMINYCVVDRHPETRSALKFALSLFGFVSLCMYGKGISGKHMQTNKEEHTVTVDRTAWLDLSLGRVIHGTIRLPVDISTDFRQHIKVPVRRYELDRDGNPVGRYVSPNPNDHHAHARNYAEIALPLALNIQGSTDIPA